MGWLYALHARSSIARGRGLQALYMLNGMRDQISSVLCLRVNLEPDQGRGVDQLPEVLKDRLINTMVRSVQPQELARAFAALTELLSEQVDANASSMAGLRRVLDELVRDSVD